MRLEESIREAKMKGLSLYGSEINNIKGAQNLSADT